LWKNTIKIFLCKTCFLPKSVWDQEKPKSAWKKIFLPDTWWQLPPSYSPTGLCNNCKTGINLLKLSRKKQETSSAETTFYIIFQPFSSSLRTTSPPTGPQVYSTKQIAIVQRTTADKSLWYSTTLSIIQASPKVQFYIDSQQEPDPQHSVSHEISKILSLQLMG
jgi:hypothetical protein